MVRKVCLDQDKHASSVLRNLKDMTLDGELCDFTVKIIGRELRAHKCVLSANSLYFKAMMKPDTMKESQEGEVEMKDVDFECVKSCIDFMYSGYFDIPDGKIGDLLDVANMMQLDDIKEGICRILDEELNPANFYEYRNIALLYNLQGVLSKCKKYYMDNFMAISAHPGFENRSKSHLVSILESKNLKLSEEEKLLVLFRWIGEDAEKKKYAFELIKLVHLEKISSEYLNELLEHCPVVSNDLRLYRLISSTLVEDLKRVAPLDHPVSRRKADKTKLQLSQVKEPPPEGTTGRHGAQEPDKGTIVIFDCVSDRLQSFDPITNERKSFHNVGFTHPYRFSPVFIDPYIYVLCFDKTVYRLNIKDKNSTWERMRDMKFKHGDFPPSVSLSGILFVVGSDEGAADGVMNVVERFDPATNEWVRLLDKPGHSIAHALVTIADSIYAIGGFDPTCEISLNKVYKFTPSSSLCVELEPMRKARRNCNAVDIGQRIFVIGGLTWDIKVEEVESYDVTSRQWTLLSPMPRRRQINFAHHVGDGSIFVFSYDMHRYGSWPDLGEINKYEISSNIWSQGTDKNVEKNNVFCSLSIYK